MTEQRYDVLAVSRVTGLVRIKAGNHKEASAKYIADSLGKVGLERDSHLYTVSPTGTYKDGDHYPREVEA